MSRLILYWVLLLLYRQGMRFEEIWYDEYRVPLICRLGFHEPSFFLNGATTCVRCRMESQLRAQEDNATYRW